MATITEIQTNGHSLSGTHSNTAKALPPFPENIPTAPLLTLSYQKLLNNDVEEVNRLAKACVELGFFYLDMRGSGDAILSDADKLFDVAVDLLGLPIEEKRKYDFVNKNSYFGYKEVGGNIVDRSGRKDRNEWYNVSKDDMLGISEPLPGPDVLNNSRDLYKSFMTSCHGVIIMLLNHLNTYLDLPPSTLANLHRLEGNSGDQVRSIKAPPQPTDDRTLSLGQHTDFGSVTVLFNRLGGLQILPPGADGQDTQWVYVKPLPGHAIINLGDAMAKFTNGLLRSNIHRVVSPPGEQGDFTRYSLVYFGRPENEVLMKRLQGSSKIPELAHGEVDEEINAKDWIIRRALGHRHALKGDQAADFDSVQGTEKMSMRVGKV